MCNLCSDDPKVVQAEKDNLRTMADLFHAFSGTLRDMSKGEIGPHSIEIQEHITPYAHTILKYLVEEWV